MFVVMKKDTVWGYYDSLGEAIAAMEEERQKEDGTELRMINDSVTVKQEEIDDGRDL